MIAIIETGGKQYIIKSGEKLDVEKLPQKEGDSITFNKVLLTATDKEVKIGRPYVDGALVTVTLIGHGKGKKIRIMRYHSKTRHRRRKGHRQLYSRIEVANIK